MCEILELRRFTKAASPKHVCVASLLLGQTMALETAPARYPTGKAAGCVSIIPGYQYVGVVEWNSVFADIKRVQS
jgi:hypothetical protein